MMEILLSDSLDPKFKKKKKKKLPQYHQKMSIFNCFLKIKAHSSYLCSHILHLLALSIPGIMGQRSYHTLRSNCQNACDHRSPRHNEAKVLYSSCVVKGHF